MKLILTLISILLCNQLLCANYYFSNAGDDSRTSTQAQNPATPWATITKLNAFASSLSPGDSVLFKRGDSFTGTIRFTGLGSSGSPIIIGAYSTGAKPIITGLTTLSSWTNLSGNIWESGTTLSVSEESVVLVNDVIKAMGRYPNTGYLTYQSHSGTTSITSNAISGLTSYVGAELVVRLNNFWTDRCIITGQTSTTVTFTAQSNSNPTDGFGFFFQNSASTLDQAGEWFYNTSTNKVRVYSTSSPTNIKASNVDTLIKLATSYVTIDNLSLQGGNIYNVYIGTSSNVTVQSCDSYYAGKDNIFSVNSGTLTVNACQVNSSFNRGISSGSTNTNSITNNTVRNTGIFPGMGWKKANDGVMYGIQITGVNSTAQGNTVIGTGYIPIVFGGEGTLIKNNYVDSFCFNKDDGGGIYGSNGSRTLHTLRMIQDNVVLNGIGALSGSPNTIAAAQGIYADDFTDHVIISGNTIANCIRGIFLHETNNITVRGNTVYNCTDALFTQSGTADSVYSSNIKSNIFFARTSTQLLANLNSGKDNISFIGTFDSNYYCRPILEPNNINSTSSSAGGVFKVATPGAKYFSLDVWKTLYNKDANSHKTALTIQDPNSVDFKYNETASPKTVALTGDWKDITGANYSGNLTLQPYTSKILINGYPDTFAYSHPIINVQNKHYITSWNQLGSFDTVIIKSTTAMTGTFFSNVGGTASRHWVVINEGGPVVTKGGMDCYDIHYIDFYGYGSADDYGFIFNAQNAGFAFPLKGKSHHIRFYGIIVNGGTQEGFTAKIEASDFVDYKCDTTVGRFVQTGLYYENCKVRYNGGEAWYMNSTGWDSRDIASCAIGPNNAFEGNDAATTITNSGTFTNKVYIASDLHNANKTVTVVAKIARVSGTISGSVTVSGSNNGSSYTSLQTQTLTNVANNTYNFNFTPSLYRYYKVDVTTSGTMSANLNSYINFYFKPPPSDSITITKCVSIAPGRSTTNFSNLSHGVYTFNKHWHVGRELNTQQGRALACGGAVISPIITDNKCFGSFNNNFWIASEGNIIFERNWGDSSGFYATSPNPEQNAAVQLSTTGSRSSSVTWKLRNNSFYHGSGGGGSIQYVLYTSNRNSDTGNIICNNYGNDVLCGNCLSIQPGPLVYSNTCNVTNQPPTANAGPNDNITLPTNTYQLQGAANDFDGSVVSTVWSQVSGPTYTINNPNILFPTLTNLVVGVYVFQLTVTDNSGAVTTDNMRLTVNAAPVNNPPVANAGNDITIQLPATSTQLSGTATDDVSVASTVWFQTAGTAATISNVNILNPNITGLTTAGTRTFRLIVTDGGGLKDTDFVNVIVLPAPNVPPVVNAGPDQTVNLPTTTVNLSGTVTDETGITSTLWSNTDGCSITSASSLTTTGTCTIPGPHVFTLTATDDSGATTQDQMTATFVAAANTNPTITHISDMTVYLPLDSIAMPIVASDADGTIENYFTYIIQTLFSARVARENKINPAIKQLTKGDTIIVVRRVTDDDSAFGFDTTTIIVLDTTNTAPFARINRDTTTYLDPPVSQISVDGSSSFDNDPGDFISGYLWTQTGGSPTILTGTTTSILHIDGMTPGVYNFRLVVTDSHGLTDFIDFQIQVTVALKFKIIKTKTRDVSSSFFPGPPPPIASSFKHGFNSNSADSAQNRLKKNSVNWPIVTPVNEAYSTGYTRYPGGTSSLTYFPDTLGRIAGRILYNFFTLIGDVEHQNQYSDQNTRYKTYDYTQFLTMANAMGFTPVIVLNNQFYRDGDSIYLLVNLVDKVGTVYSGGGSLHADRWTVATDSLINQINYSHSLYPGVIYWELGNECYARMSAVDYVETATNFINTISALYPNDKFIAPISKGDYQHNPIENDQWNHDIINGLNANGMLHRIDHFAPHFYWGFADFKTTEQGLIDRMNAKFFENVYNYLINDAGFPFDYNPKFFYTEYGVSGLATGSNINPGTNTQYHALLQLDLLMKFHSKNKIAGGLSHTWVNGNNGAFYDSIEASHLGYIPSSRHDNPYWIYITPQAIADSLFMATTGDEAIEGLSTLVLSQYRVCVTQTGSTQFTQILNFTNTTQSYPVTGSVNWTAVHLPDLTDHDWNVTANKTTGSASGTLTLPARSFVYYNQ